MAGKSSVFLNNSAPACDDNWLNLRQNENKNKIEAGGLTLNDAVSNQEAVATSNVALNISYFIDTGIADAYVLDIVSPNVAPDRLRDGMRAIFKTSNNNTGACTVNIAGLGIKDIKKQDGITDPDANDISTNMENEIIYDNSLGVFKLKEKNGLEKINEIIISNDATIEFINLDDGYNHRFVFENIVPITDAIDLLSRISDDNGSTWESTSTDYKHIIRSLNSAGTLTQDVSIVDTSIKLTDTANPIGNTSGRNLFGKLDLQNPSSTTRFINIIADFCYLNNAGTLARSYVGANYVGAITAINGIQFYASSGNLDTGKIIHYRYK